MRLGGGEKFQKTTSLPLPDQIKSAHSPASGSCPIAAASVLKLGLANMLSVTARSLVMNWPRASRSRQEKPFKGSNSPAPRHCGPGSTSARPSAAVGAESATG